jgi:hypothetical protein
MATVSVVDHNHPVEEICDKGCPVFDANAKLDEIRPDYVPDRGLFIEIRKNLRGSRVWLNGDLLPYVQSIKINAEAGKMVSADIRVLNFDLHAEIDEEDITHKLIRRKAAWK